MTNIKNVTVLGTGVLGSQIAYQAAFHGFTVTAWDISDEALTSARERYQGLARRYKEDSMPKAEDIADDVAASITLTTDLDEATAAPDIIIEAIPEKLELKQYTWAQVGAKAPEHTIFCTNSSTLLPSSIKFFTGRPDKFLAYHFANEIWRHNTGEVMGTDSTDPTVFDTVVEFAEEMGMVPIPVYKEKAGYLLNSLLVPLLNAAQQLVAFGFSEPEAVDNTWKIATGAPKGPFEILDVVGLGTAYNIASAGDETAQKIADWLKENYIDHGKLGVSTGEGFYKYDHAESPLPDPSRD